MFNSLFPSAREVREKLLDLMDNLGVVVDDHFAGCEVTLYVSKASFTTFLISETETTSGEVSRA